MSHGAERPSPDGNRVPTGNPSLDRMLDGGLLPGRPYLVVGPSGTGKSTLALQFLCEGVRRGERVLFVTLEEPPNEVLWNHRALWPELGRVEVFDAIPDVMRYERTPFKDIASVRSAVPFEHVEPTIRRTPELTSVEVTMSALEQMLRTEVMRRNYRRVVIDSLTALQYFCMKGYDLALGAQSFLRFLSDLRVTAMLTVESPVEDVETTERMLARGEIGLFRWETDGVTVRAIGVEKFRGSSHDVRLHPYRIGAHGIDINLDSTISRDTLTVVGELFPVSTGAVEPVLHDANPVDVLETAVRDWLLVGLETAAIRGELEAALAAAQADEPAEAARRVSTALANASVAPDESTLLHRTLPAHGEAALARILARAEATRAGVAPVRLPEPPILAAQLNRLLRDLLPPTELSPVLPSEAAGSPAVPGAPSAAPSAASTVGGVSLSASPAPAAAMEESGTEPDGLSRSPSPGASEPSPEAPRPVLTTLPPDVPGGSVRDAGPVPLPGSAGPTPAALPPEDSTERQEGSADSGSPPEAAVPGGGARGPRTLPPAPILPAPTAAGLREGSPSPPALGEEGIPVAAPPSAANVEPLRQLPSPPILRHRSEPPPLPSLRTLPTAPGPLAGEPVAGADAATPPPAPGAAEAPPAEPGRRKRKATAGSPRRKATASVAADASTARAGENGEGVAPTKPKRKYVRKKKAPPVLAATPGLTPTPGEATAPGASSRPADGAAPSDPPATDLKSSSTEPPRSELP